MAKKKPKRKAAKKPPILKKKLSKKALLKVNTRQGHNMATSPNSFAVYTVCAGKVLVRWLNKKIKPFEDPINAQARAEFKRYPQLQRLIVEVYSTNGVFKVRPRTATSLPPKGAVEARCLKYRCCRKDGTWFLGTRWDLNPFREPSSMNMKRLGLKLV